MRVSAAGRVHQPWDSDPGQSVARAVQAVVGEGRFSIGGESSIARSKRS